MAGNKVAKKSLGMRLKRQAEKIFQKAPSEAIGDISEIPKLVKDENLIGTGSYGYVHGPFTWQKHNCAVKRISLRDSSDHVEISIQKKKEIWDSLSHNNLIQVLQVFLNRQIVYVVMEYIGGGTLRRALDTCGTSLSLPYFVVLDWSRQIADGMLYLHKKNIVHRDLKSVNVLLSEPFDTSNTDAKITLKIADFDEMREHQGTATMTVKGTYAWMAPEVLTSERFSKTSDVWSYGVVVWEIITRELPHKGQSIQALISKASEGRLALPLPANLSIPETLSQLLNQCFRLDGANHPSFQDIVDLFQRNPEVRNSSSNDEDKIDTNSIIARLLEVRCSKPGKIVQLSIDEVRGLCLKSKEIFLSQPCLLELETPLKVCGDIHGQYYDLLRLFEFGSFPPENTYLFLGNYVDYGKQSLETMCLLLAYKIKYPENFFLLRGNHEQAAMNRLHGFYDECKRRYNVELWKTFTDCFNCLPVAAIIDEEIFCCHGGLSPDLQSMEQIRRIMRPTDVPDQGLLCDLLWSNPDKHVREWGENDIGVSLTFGADVVKKFLHKHNLDLICRSNQVVEDGYEFFSGRQLVTLFSAPNFLGEYDNECDNAGAILSIDESLMCSFQILRPADKKKFPYGGNRGDGPTVLL